MQVGPELSESSPAPRERPGWRHLAAGAVEYVLARRLTPAEQMEAAGWLNSPEEAELFWRQPPADQRHGLTAARLVARERPERRDLIRAALLHDVGKGRSGLGLWGRTRAALAERRRWKPSPRTEEYLRHGEAGAGELAAAGAEEMVVGYARAHHGPRPPEIPPGDWEVLLRADRPLPKKPPPARGEPETGRGR